MRPSDFSKWSCRWIDAGGVTVLLVLGLVTYFAGIRPLVRRHASAAAKLARLTARRGELHKASAALQDLEDRHLATKRILTQTPLRLQRASHANRRLAEIAELAAKCGVKIDRIQPDEAVEEGLYDVVPISLAARASYPTCVRFLHKLRKAFPDTGLISLQLSGNPAEPETPPVLQCRLKWHTVAERDGVKKNTNRFALGRSVSSG